MMRRRIRSMALTTPHRLTGLAILFCVALLGCTAAGQDASPSAIPVEQTDTEKEQLPMLVTVQVSLEVARVLQGQSPPTGASQKLVETVEELGLELKPVHPGAEDPLLAPFFTAEVPDAVAVDEIIASLLQLESVEAAYVKPPAEPAAP